MRHRFRLPAALLVLTALVVGVSAGTARAKTYRDQRHGYSINILPGWTQTPTQPGETTIVAKFKSDRKRDFATLDICRFSVGGGETTPGSEEAGSDSPGIPIPRRFGPPPPRDGKDYLGQILDRWKAQLERIAQRTGRELTIPPLGKPKKVKFGKIEGEIYTHEMPPLPRMRFPGAFRMAGIVRRGDEEYLILYTCPGNQAKKLKGPFLASIRSFRFGEARPVEEEDIRKRGRARWKNKPLLDPEKRERIKKSLVGTWRFIDTPYYLIIYNCDDRLAWFVAEQIEWMREYAYQKVFPPVEPLKECMVVRVCREMDEYHHYGGPMGSAGYWSNGTDEFVLPDLSRSKKPDKQTLGVLHHEGFHQFIYYSLLKHNPPVWFNEGFAEYFFCVQPAGKRMKFLKRHPMRYSVVKTAAATGKLIPIKEFIHLSHAQYMARANLCYAEGWAFATWLKNITRNERYRQVPEIFFREMQKGWLEQKRNGGGGFPGMGMGPSPVVKRALEKAFEGIDLDKMNEEFVEAVKKKM